MIRAKEASHEKRPRRALFWDNVVTAALGALVAALLLIGWLW